MSPSNNFVDYIKSHLFWVISYILSSDVKTDLMLRLWRNLITSNGQILLYNSYIQNQFALLLPTLVSLWA